MKRLFLALVILSAASAVTGAFRTATIQLRHEAAAGREAWLAQTQLVVRTRSERFEIEEKIRELKSDLEAQPRAAGSASPATLIATNGAAHLSPEQSEALLAELGFNWNSTGNYLVVSKNTLRTVRLDGIKDAKLSDVACDVLAVTPQERSAMEGLTQQIDADYKAWAGSHAQREEPSGDIVAKYSLSADPVFSQSLSNTFTSGIMATLGSERSGLLESYANQWMTDHGIGMFNTEPATLTVKRTISGTETYLTWELRQGGGSMSTTVSPWQFPEAFRPVFPGGWPDVAKREGFDLPKEFKK
jgi:hypothetical protein